MGDKKADKPSAFVIKNRFTHYIQAAVVIGAVYGGYLAFTHLEGLQTAASGLWGNWLNATMTESSTPTFNIVTTVIFRAYWGVILLACLLRLMIISEMYRSVRMSHGYKNEWADYFVIPDLIRRNGIAAWMVLLSPIFITMDLYYMVIFGTVRILTFKFYKKR